MAGMPPKTVIIIFLLQKARLMRGRVVTFGSIHGPSERTVRSQESQAHTSISRCVLCIIGTVAPSASHPWLQSFAVTTASLSLVNAFKLPLVAETGRAVKPFVREVEDKHKSAKVCRYVAYDHTTLNIPVLVRTP